MCVQRTRSVGVPAGAAGGEVEDVRHLRYMAGADLIYAAPSRSAGWDHIL